jgi:hypothetical protein
MLNKYRQLIIGIIIGGILTISTTAFAKNEKIDAFFNNIEIKINDKKVKNMDVEPFIYSGRTFVPVRFIAENLGMEVIWNETTNTVELKNVVDGKKYMKSQIADLNVVTLENDDVYISASDLLNNKDKVVSKFMEGYEQKVNSNGIVGKQQHPEDAPKITSVNLSGKEVD